MITIPLNPNTGIRIPIPAQTTSARSEGKRTETIERIGVSIQEAATMLGVSKKTFYPLIKEGKVRTVSIGRRVLVSVQSLRDFVDGKKEPGNSAENSDELQGENE
jgi:excisionase family DNA binding protein